MGLSGWCGTGSLPAGIGSHVANGWGHKLTARVRGGNIEGARFPASQGMGSGDQLDAGLDVDVMRHPWRSGSVHGCDVVTLA